MLKTAMDRFAKLSVAEYDALAPYERAVFTRLLSTILHDLSIVWFAIPRLSLNPRGYFEQLSRIWLLESVLTAFLTRTDGLQRNAAGKNQFRGYSMIISPLITMETTIPDSA